MVEYLESYIYIIMWSNERLQPSSLGGQQPFLTPSEFAKNELPNHIHQRAPGWHQLLAILLAIQRCESHPPVLMGVYGIYSYNIIIYIYISPLILLQLWRYTVFYVYFIMGRNKDNNVNCGFDHFKMWVWQDLTMLKWDSQYNAQCPKLVGPKKQEMQTKPGFSVSFGGFYITGQRLISWNRWMFKVGIPPWKPKISWIPVGYPKMLISRSRQNCWKLFKTIFPRCCGWF